MGDVASFSAYLGPQTRSPTYVSLQEKNIRLKLKHSDPHGTKNNTYRLNIIVVNETINKVY